MIAPPIPDHRRPALPALTGIRFFAALGPLLLHSASMVAPDLPIARHGDLGVDFFFMLSGFVLGYIHAQEFERRNWLTYRRFLALRLGRIWPAYAAVLLVMAWGIARHQQWWATPFDAAQQRLLAHLAMLQNWGIVDPNEFNQPGWSVSVEWFVYLLFPLFVFALGRAGRPMALILTPALIGLLYGVLGFFPVIADNTSASGLLRGVFEFAVGFLLWRLYCDAAIRQWNWAAIGTACLLGVVIMAVATPKRILVDGGFVALLAPFLLSLAFGRGPAARICAWRPIVFFGEISYSLYLVHFQVMYFMARMMATWSEDLPPYLLAAVFAGATVLASLIAGIALHFIVERPCRRWVRNRLGYA